MHLYDDQFELWWEKYGIAFLDIVACWPGGFSFFLPFFLLLIRKESIYYKRTAHKATTSQIKHKYPICLICL